MSADTGAAIVFSRWKSVLRIPIGLLLTVAAGYLAATVTADDVQHWHGRRAAVFHMLGGLGTQIFFALGAAWMVAAEVVWVGRAISTPDVARVSERGIWFARFFRRPLLVAWHDVEAIRRTRIWMLGFTTYIELAPSIRFPVQAVRGGSPAIDEWVAAANASIPDRNPAR